MGEEPVSQCTVIIFLGMKNSFVSRVFFDKGKTTPLSYPSLHFCSNPARCEGLAQPQGAELGGVGKKEEPFPH